MNTDKIPLFDVKITQKNEKQKIITTSISIDNIENKLNKILDKVNENIQYYINITESYYCISFKVGLQQIDALIETMVHLYIYKDNNNLSIIGISEKINEHQE